VCYSLHTWCSKDWLPKVFYSSIAFPVLFNQWISGQQWSSDLPLVRKIEILGPNKLNTSWK
jgi:hypothetical protein